RYQYKGRFEQIKRDKLAQEFSLVDYFPTVFQQGGFDLVIGNPPYIGEKGNKDMFRELKKYALRDFYSGKMDLFYFFFHLGLDIVKEGGQVALITTDYYLTATGAYKLRTDLEERGIIRRLIDFNNTRLFPAAMGQHNLITIVKKNTTANQSTLAKTTITNREGDASRRTILDILAGEDKQSNYYSIPQKLLYQGSEKYLQLEVGAIDELLTKIKVQGQQLGEICSVNQGIVSGCDRVSPRHIRNYDLADELKGRGIFVVDEAEVAELDLQGADKELLRPWFKNSDIEQYWCRSRNKGEYLLYLDQELKELPASIADYFAPVEEILQSRREVEADRLAWWQLQWPRCAEIFAGAKLVVPQRSKQNTFAYTEKPWYASADVYYITQPQAEIDLKYILALLNSKLYFLWFYYKGKKKGKLLELYQRPLTRVPIKPVSSAKQQIFIDLVEQIQTNKQELLEKKQISLQTIQSEFELTGQTALQTIVSNSKHYKQHYQGQASIVRNFKLEIDDDLMIVYSAKSSEGYYKLFEFELADSLLQNYLQIYLENLTDQQLAEINQAEISTLVERVLAIKIPSYHKTDQVQVLMDRWQNIEQKITNLQTEINELQEEIDYLVYQLYQFSTDEIDCLTEQYAKIKDY
ncbi:MAG: Eco57I restriction-modification methylase domain-containing protein, partial [Bacillota bacterium]